jgi:uncharacterized membrane protein SpoIIM required for sporulation
VKTVTAHTVGGAIWRARRPIASVGLAYLAALLIGIAMAHLGSPLAIRTRDQIVGQASASDPSSLALSAGHPLPAALIDFSRNLLLGAVPTTVAGLGVVFVYPIAAYRGWIGGIVSVDGQHLSRLAQPGEAVYYLVTLLLQLIPYTLSGGAGVHLGLAFYHSYAKPEIAKWLGIPRAALADVAQIYILVVPLFLIASLWEFLMR